MSEFFDGQYFIGQRVIDAEEYRGTIRYIGPVASAKKATDIWLGVEWDKDTRGKHDGSCVDANQVTHRHFSCPPGAGSFVKPNKIQTGRSFVSALHERYVGLDAPLITGEENTLPDSFVVTAKGERKAIEFVGESLIRKRQQLADVVEVSVRNSGVSSVGDGLGALAQHVVSVDLQDNLLSNWDVIVDISKELPQLTTMLLHGNRIGDISLDDVESFKGYFSNITLMALNLCGMKSWETIKVLHEMFPQVKELYLAVNSFGQNISSLSSSYFPHLTTMDISSCNITSWNAVRDACGELPSLEALVLDCNAIDGVLGNEEGKFSRLSRLSLASTKLASWSDVNALATYPMLTSLRLTNIPLFAQKGASEVRPEVIARIALLQVFNGSNVTARERMDSEKIYLRKMLRQKRVIDNEHEDNADTGVEQNQNRDEDTCNFHNMHPRFDALNDLYGADLLPMGGEGPSSGLTSMASDMVSVTLHNLSFASNGSLEPISRKLPASLKVDRLRLMVKQLFGLETHKQQLSVRQYKSAVPTLMDEDSATIGFYGAIDGADIFINEANE